GAAGAGADRHRHRLRHDGAVPRGAARLARPDRHRPCRRSGAGPVMPALDHLVIAPIVLPLVAAALMLLLDERRRPVRTALSLASTFGLLAIAIVLMAMADASPPGAGVSRTYPLGNWPAP